MINVRVYNDGGLGRDKLTLASTPFTHIQNTMPDNTVYSDLYPDGEYVAPLSSINNIYVYNDHIYATDRGQLIYHAPTNLHQKRPIHSPQIPTPPKIQPLFKVQDYGRDVLKLIHVIFKDEFISLLHEHRITLKNEVYQFKHGKLLDTDILVPRTLTPLQLQGGLSVDIFLLYEGHRDAIVEKYGKTHISYQSSDIYVHCEVVKNTVRMNVYIFNNAKSPYGSKWGLSTLLKDNIIVNGIGWYTSNTFTYIMQRAFCLPYGYLDKQSIRRYIFNTVDKLATQFDMDKAEYPFPRDLNNYLENLIDETIQ